MVFAGSLVEAFGAAQQGFQRAVAAAQQAFDSSGAAELHEGSDGASASAAGTVSQHSRQSLSCLLQSTLCQVRACPDG